MERAVIYCRVSTEEEIQINALESQIKEAREAAACNGWLLTGEYIDEGRSGTTTKRRDEYNRLFEDMESNSFEIVVVKSQDRLMRNTREWYKFVDRLVQSHKKLYFYLDSKFYTPDDALITGIKAILAEEYSRDLSKKINHAHKNRQKNGSNVLITSNTWGYDKIGKEIVINEKEAAIVRLIYELCLLGYGSRCISKELQNRGIKSRSGGAFPEATVRRIIRNPLFMGTAVMNRSHMDFDTKKVKRTPEKEWFIHENAVPAIVPEDLWRKANESMDARASQGKTTKCMEEAAEDKRKRGIYSGKYELSGKILCGECGSVYWRRHRKNTSGQSVIEWSCSEYVRRGRKNKDTNRGTGRNRIITDGGCDNIHIKESDLMEALFDIPQMVSMEDRKSILKNALEILADVFLDSKEQVKKLETKEAHLMKKREYLLEKVLSGTISDDLFEKKDRSLKTEIEKLRQQILESEKSIGETEKKLCRLEEIENELIDIVNKDLCLYRMLEHIKQIQVNRTHLLISFDLCEPVEIKMERKGYKKAVFSVCRHR